MIKYRKSFMPEVIARFTILKQTIAVPAKSSTGDVEGWAGLGQRQLQFPCSQLMGMSNRTPTIELIHWIIVLSTNLREDFKITEKAPNRAFSWVKVLSLSHFHTIKT